MTHVSDEQSSEGKKKRSQLWVVRPHQNRSHTQPFSIVDTILPSGLFHSRLISVPSQTWFGRSNKGNPAKTDCCCILMQVFWYFRARKKNVKTIHSQAILSNLLGFGVYRSYTTQYKSNALQCSSPWYGLNDEDTLSANRFLHIHSSFWPEGKTKAAVS